MLNVSRPGETPKGYSILKPAALGLALLVNPLLKPCAGINMKASPRRTQQILKGIPHTPFEEFKLKKLDDLVALLEKTKPKSAKVEASPMEGTHHSPCMQEMTAIMVHDIYEEKEGEKKEGEKHPQIYALYQYCSVCGIAMRVF